jgi:hypothetical protein
VVLRVGGDITCRRQLAVELGVKAIRLTSTRVVVARSAAKHVIQGETTTAAFLALGVK